MSEVGMTVSVKVRRRPLLALIVAGFAIGATITPFNAAPPASATYNGTMCSGLPSWSLNKFSYNSTWMTPLNGAIASWNVHSKLNIYIPTSSGNTLTVASYSDGWYGLYTYGPGQKRTFKVNSRTISAAATNFTNFARSTTAHELGHGFCLDDNPSTSQASLMKHSRNRNTLYTPQSYDWADINAHY